MKPLIKIREMRFGHILFIDVNHVESIDTITNEIMMASGTVHSVSQDEIESILTAKYGEAWASGIITRQDAEGFLTLITDHENRVAKQTKEGPKRGRKPNAK